MRTKIILKSLLVYLFTTVMFSCSILFLIPKFVNIGLRQVEAYIISAGLGLSILLILAIVLYKFEKDKNINFFKRFRLKRLSKNDILATTIGIISILILDGLIFGINKLIIVYSGNDIGLSQLPEFTGMTQLIKGEYTIIPVYLIYLFFNIFGEELLWRGYLLPIQESCFTKYAWIFNSIFWLIFHLIFGISVIMMIPLLFILPYLVQRQKNTWIGILIHSITGFIGFISILNGVL